MRKVGIVAGLLAAAMSGTIAASAVAETSSVPVRSRKSATVPVVRRKSKLSMLEQHGINTYAAAAHINRVSQKKKRINRRRIGNFS